MIDDERAQLIADLAAYQARFEHERERLRIQPDSPDITTAENMRRIIDHLSAEPDGLTRGALMADMGFHDSRPGRIAWDQLRALKLITDRSPFKVTKAGEAWYP